MVDDIKPPDQRTLDAHLMSARFLSGEEKGRWELLESAFPHLYLRVVGRDIESDHRFSQDIHLTCENYPDTAPFVERWDYVAKARPAAPTIGDPGFIDALKDWSPGPPIDNAGGGIYRAWQRHASTHNNWAQIRPDEAWHRNREITFVLEHLYALVSQQAVWLAIRIPVSTPA